MLPEPVWFKKFVLCAYEYLYKQNGNENYLNLAKEFAKYAENIASDNKYVKEQVLSL